MEPPLPSYAFRSGHPTLWDMARYGVSDPARIIPADIVRRPCIAVRGAIQLAIVADPTLARKVLAESTAPFGRNRMVRRLFRRAWGTGLAAAEGESWAMQRRAAAPAFRPSAVQEAVHDFAAAGTWAVGATPLDQIFDFGKIAPHIIARVVFPALIGVRHGVDVDTAADAISPYIAKIARFTNADFLPLPESWLDRLYGINRAPSVRHLRALAADLASRPAMGQGETMVARVSKVGPMEDNIRGLFPAAMDTTTMALSWSLWLLARHPEWQERVAEEEANAPDLTLKNLPIARAVVQEAMRLYPPAPLLARSVTQPTEFAGMRLKPGDSALVAVYAMHRHHDHWEQPDAFRPDRFLTVAGMPDAYLPFGTGARMCIAAQFAVAEVAAILAVLSRSLEFQVAGPHPQVSLITSCRSTTGWHVSASQRA